MSAIEELLNQIIMRGWEWIWSVSWYWIPAGLGFAFRFGLLKYKIWDSEMRVKVILRDIGIIFGLTILWSGLNSYELDSNTGVMVFILTFVYIVYGLAESCEDTGGSTESILLILKSVLLTMLSFQEIGGTIFGAIVTVLNLDSDEEQTYRIVGDDEADFKQNLISVNSPIARGLIGKEEDDVVVIKTPGGEVEFEVIKVEYL